jgi:hypothetical protein
MNYYGKKGHEEKLLFLIQEQLDITNKVNLTSNALTEKSVQNFASVST